MHVLVLDDNLLTAAAVQNQLWQHGYTATIVASPQQALDVLRMQAPTLVIVNLSGHAFDAPAAIRMMRADAAHGRIRIIGFCGHVETDRRKRAYEAGADLIVTNSQALKTLNSVISDQ